MQKKTMTPGEVSGVNPSAVRGPTGIWNEETLPVVDWEVPEERIVLSQLLQVILRIESPVARVAATKLHRLRAEHERDLHVLGELSEYIAGWEYAGKEMGSRLGNDRVLFRDESERWYAASFGKDLNASYNLITVFGGSDSGFLQNRLRTMTTIVEREK